MYIFEGFEQSIRMPVREEVMRKLQPLLSMLGTPIVRGKVVDSATKNCELLI